MACAASLASGQFYDGSNMEFGKNRVQHRTFEWQYLPTSRAEVYYYQGGKAYANRITSEIKEWIEDVEGLYDRNFDGTVQVLEDLKGFPGFSDGLVDLGADCERRDSKTGLVCGLAPAGQRLALSGGA